MVGLLQTPGTERVIWQEVMWGGPIREIVQFHFPLYSFRVTSKNR